MRKVKATVKLQLDVANDISAEDLKQNLHVTHLFVNWRGLPDDQQVKVVTQDFSVEESGKYEHNPALDSTEDWWNCTIEPNRIRVMGKLGGKEWMELSAKEQDYAHLVLEAYLNFGCTHGA